MRLDSTRRTWWADQLPPVVGRFAHRMGRQERRKLLGPDEMPAHDKVAAVVRDTDADADAEFTADFTGMLDLIEAAASQTDARRATQRTRDGRSAPWTSE